MYFYNVSHAAVNLRAETIYIVEISNTGSTGTGNCQWLWATRSD